VAWLYIPLILLSLPIPVLRVLAQESVNFAQFLFVKAKVGGSDNAIHLFSIASTDNRSGDDRMPQGPGDRDLAR